MRTLNLKDDTMNKSDLQSVYIFPIYPRDSKTISDRGFVNPDNGSMGGSPWVCLYRKDNIFDFDTFDGPPDNILLSQVPKPKPYQK